MGIKSDRSALNYLYCLFTSEEFVNQKDLLSNGATMQGINNEIFGEILVPNISHDVAVQFGKEADELVSLMLNLKEKIHVLKNEKRLLLDKYFS